jgi:hypothetical protein
MSWLQSHFKSRASKPFPSVTVDEVVAQAGGLDRAILLMRAQQRELEENYALNRENAKDAPFPETHAEAMTAIADMALANGAYLEACECRRNAAAGAQ